MRHGGRGGASPQGDTGCSRRNSCNCAVCLTTSATSGNQQGRISTQAPLPGPRGARGPRPPVRLHEACSSLEGALLGDQRSPGPELPCVWPSGCSLERQAARCPDSPGCGPRCGHTGHRRSRGRGLQSSDSARQCSWLEVTVLSTTAGRRWGQLHVLASRPRRGPPPQRSRASSRPRAHR